MLLVLEGLSESEAVAAPLTGDVDVMNMPAAINARMSGEKILRGDNIMREL